MPNQRLATLPVIEEAKASLYYLKDYIYVQFKYITSIYNLNMLHLSTIKIYYIYVQLMYN